jgi:hypothetical protein
MKSNRFRFKDDQNRSILNDAKKPCRIAGGLLACLVLLMVLCLGTALAGKIPEESNQKLKGVRVPFIMNQGQMDQQVRFYAKTFSGTVYVTDQGQIVYELPADKARKDQGWVLVEEALDGLPLKEIKGEKESKSQVSYFIGNDQTQWKRGLSTYETVDLGEVYKGIGLKLRAYGGSVEKLYYVSPGREAREIRIKVKGADFLKVNDQEELEVLTGHGPVIFSRPKAFQQEGHQRKDVAVAYLVDGDSYGFKVGSYDKSRELIIDPLIQSTYLGGNNSDLLYSMAVSGGNVYVAGNTLSTNFPGTTGGAQPGFGGNQDAFVSLLSSDLKTLIQSTYLGGNNIDVARSIAVSGGNVYVTGSTDSSNFPGTAGGAQEALGGHTDAFVSLLNAGLTQLVQSTYLGGIDYDSASSIAVSGGNVYVAGYTGHSGSTDFPGTAGGGGALPKYGGGGNDAFVSLLSSDLKHLVRSTYLGGNGIDGAESLAVSEGRVYVAGHTQSTNFPGTAGGAQTTYGGGTWDAFVSVLSDDLTKLGLSTYLGGTDSDGAHAVFVSGGNVYVAGYTQSTNFPGTAGGAQQIYGGGVHDVFVSLLSTDLKHLVQSTYLGGTDNDVAWAIAVSGGNVYLAGGTYSTNFPGTAGGAQPAYGGGSIDAFVSLLNSDLKTLIQSTYLGGNNTDGANSLAVSGGNVYVAGSTYSNNFPGTAGGAQPGYGGGSGDAFVALLSGDLKANMPVNQFIYLPLILRN